MKDKFNQIKATLIEMMFDVDEGVINPLDFFIELKQLDEIINGDSKTEGLLTQCQTLALDEAEKYKNDVYHGFKINLRSGGKYKYDHVDQIKQLEEKLKQIKKEIKELQEASKAAYINNRIMLDQDTGEEIKPAQYIPYQTSIILTKEKGDV